MDLLYLFYVIRGHYMDFLLHFFFCFTSLPLFLKYIYSDFCSGRNGEEGVWAAESGFPRHSLGERAGGECLQCVVSP